MPPIAVILTNFPWTLENAINCKWIQLNTRFTNDEKKNEQNVLIRMEI